MDDSVADEHLMRHYCAGDASAFDTLYLRNKAPLYRYLRRQLSARHADELFQDIWLKIVKARDSYRATAKFTTFLYTIAHRRLIDHYRRNSKASLVSYDENAGSDDDCAEPLPTRESEQPEHAVDRQRQVARLFELIGSLPAAQREAFLLQEEGGLTVEQIAVATDVNAETAKSRLRYAVNKLRHGLQTE